MAFAFRLALVCALLGGITFALGVAFGVIPVTPIPGVDFGENANVTYNYTSGMQYANTSAVAPTEQSDPTTGFPSATGFTLGLVWSMISSAVYIKGTLDAVLKDSTGIMGLFTGVVQTGIWYMYYLQWKQDYTKTPESMQT